MGSSPFPYFDAREKIAEREARAAELLKQQKFAANEDEKNRAQRAQEFSQTFGLQQQQFNESKKRIASTVNYMDAFSTNLKAQANTAKLRVQEAVTKGLLKPVEPDEPGAVKIYGQTYKPVSFEENAKQTAKAAVEAQQLANQADLSNWANTVDTADKSGLLQGMPPLLKDSLSLMGSKIGRTALAQWFVEQGRPLNLQQTIGNLVTLRAKGQISDDTFKTARESIETLVTAMSPSRADQAQYYKSRADLANYQLARDKIAQKVNGIMIQNKLALPAFNDPNFQARLNGILNKLLQTKKIDPVEASFYIQWVFHLRAPTAMNTDPIKEMIGRSLRPAFNNLNGQGTQ